MHQLLFHETTGYRELAFDYHGVSVCAQAVTKQELTRQ